METTGSSESPIGRDSALAVLKAACKTAALKDYAHKFTDNEEDLRACIYHHVRNALDTDECWRIFLSFSTLRGAADMSLCKPDLVFLRGQPVHDDVSVEILVELKNWPTVDQIRYDVNKLIELRARFPKDRPDLVFFGVGRGLQTAEDTIRAGLSDHSGVHIWLYDHDSIFQGPWPDPYRKKLKVLEAASNEVTG